jgi:hypothetical protein
MGGKLLGYGNEEWEQQEQQHKNNNTRITTVIFK